MVSFFFRPRQRRLLWRPLVSALVLCAAVPAVEAGRVVEKHVPPEYPVLALRMQLAGVVTVTASVAADGHVTTAKAERGNSLLAPAAVAAVRRWKFAPASAPSTESVNVTFDMGN